MGDANKFTWRGIELTQTAGGQFRGEGKGFAVALTRGADDRWSVSVRCYVLDKNWTAMSKIGDTPQGALGEVDARLNDLCDVLFAK